MKYGIVFFKQTANIGDDIQTYAALKYLPKVDYIIEREKLSSFVPKKNELVTTILNGWYNHDVSSLPPSPFINPLFISIHLTDHLSNKKPEYFDEVFLSYLRKYQPIGLRDDLVKEYLDEGKIDNYFSGCLTLTLNKFKNVKKTNKICLVDVDEEIYEKVSNKYEEDIIVETHKLNPHINSKLSFDKRMKNVETLLKKYQSCKLVITSRLHVALPCLAIGAPVLLIYDDKNLDIKNRLGKYTDYINYVSKKDFLKKPIYDIKNSRKYLTLRKSIETKVESFIEDSKNNQIGNENIDFYKRYYVIQKEHIDNVINAKNSIINNYENRIIEYEKLYKRLNLEKEFYQKENLIIKERLAAYKYSYIQDKIVLDKITNSRSYKLYVLLKRILRKIKRMVQKIIKLGR